MATAALYSVYLAFLHARVETVVELVTQVNFSKKGLNDTRHNRQMEANVCFNWLSHAGQRKWLIL